ncbi:OmpW/AlkL family protein [Halomonas huangheensis]|uniref:Outer membrane protein W n=1 Tax=Halomonas huangheensis TaxID=1178482 RepID=W1N841_9GAMM|nr:OmpW family outer membrane protein [Halomonas huangheensis]ALM53096.1 hypothetical protein AR456_13010 [Halomonas huangheensis]ERL51336.1 hypothetical protein BJB45_14180 [Halomonas huangheensis]
MKTSRLVGTAALLAVTAFGAQSALAYQAGDFYVRGGFEKSDPESGNGALYGDDINVSEDTGFAYGMGYLFHNKLGVELNGSQTMDQDLTAGNTGLGGSFDSTPINLMLNYYPLGGISDARVHPYAGIGVNYTHFDNESFNADLDESWGFAGQVGVDLSVTDNLLVGTWARYADVDTDVDIDGTYKTRLDIDPVTVGAGVTYRF